MFDSDFSQAITAQFMRFGRLNGSHRASATR